MMMKTWLWMMCLMWAGLSLNAADFNLYGGKPQSITLRNLTPGKDFRWELRTGNNRPMGGGQVRIDEDGNAEIQFEIPKLEPGVTVNCKLLLSPDKRYEIAFHSSGIFAPVMAALQRFGVYTENSELKQSLDAQDIVVAERSQARIFLTADIASKELTALLAAGKTVIYFADGDNEINPPIEKMRNFTLETVFYAKKSPALSVLYNKSEFKIGYDGGAGVVEVHYEQGHLVVVAPQLRRELDINPELWLILKHKITEDLQKWTKEQLSEH